MMHLLPAKFHTIWLLLLAGRFLPAAEARPSLEWRFERGIGTWTSSMTTPPEVRAGAATFRATGHDPILVSPDFSWQTSALDAVEIELRSSVSGTGEIFWRHDREGRYGGFSAELSRSFDIVAGPEVRTYRLRPFWQGRGPVITLRLDPPGGAGEFAVRSVRILPGPTGPPARPAFDFAGGASALGWRVDPPGSQRVEADGLHVRLPRASSSLASPALDLDATEARYLALDLSVPDVGVSSDPATGAIIGGTIEFGPADRPGSSRRPFRARAGVRGRYVVFMGELPTWTGKVAGLLLGLSLPGDGEVVIHGIRAVRSPAEALATDPEPTAIESPATGLEFQTTSISGDGRLPVAPPRIDIASSAPPPTHAVESDFTVAMWYFAAWEPEYRWDGWRQVAERAPWRMPLLFDSSDPEMEFSGFRVYRSSRPRAIDWHVHWMREHAVNLILWDWYPGVKASGDLDPGFFGNRALEIGFLGKGVLGGPAVGTNRFAEEISFAVMWTNHPSFDKVGEGLGEYLAEQFFLQPNYHRIDGKPLLILWSLRCLVDACGGEGAARARVEAVREAARRRGLPGVWFAGIVGPAEVPLLRALGLDGAAGYHYSGSGGFRVESRRHGEGVIEDRVEDFATQTIPGHGRLWRELADALGRDFLLATTPMQNWEPTLRPRSLVMRGTSPDAYREMLRRARAFVKRRGLRPWVSVEAWNEWLEGSYVEPSTQWGLSWLEAIRDVFGKAEAR